MNIQLSKREKDLTGQTYGRLTVIGPSEKFSGSNRCWYCQCECGELACVRGCKLRNGQTQSCGCLKKERAAETNRTHGQCYSPTYRTWQRLIQRCVNLNMDNYPHYGGKGITVCDRWRKSFEAFLEDMGERPPGMTIDWIDNSKGYESRNCRWASWETQNLNRDFVKNAKGFNKHKNKYRAQIKMNGSQVFLGYFDTPDEAQEAYKQAKMKLDLQALMD